MYNFVQFIIVINTKCVILICFETHFLYMKTNITILTFVLLFITFIIKTFLFFWKYLKTHLISIDIFIILNTYRHISQFHLEYSQKSFLYAFLLCTYKYNYSHDITKRLTARII